METTDSSREDHDSDHEAGVDSEATSDEQLSDIEKNEVEVDSGNSSPDTGPSPDGALDESDEVKDAGPM
jgi:hypothetical protein